MAVRLHRDRSIAKSLKRSLREQLDMATQGCEAADRSLPERIHFARKQCKRMRGQLKLAANGRDQDGSRELASRLRAAANRLSAIRDAYVLEESVSHIAAEVSRKLHPTRSSELIKALGDALAKQAQSPESISKQLDKCVSGLKKVRRGLREWRVALDRESILERLGRAYRQGRRLAKRIAADGIWSEEFAVHEHELRKQTKALSYQLEFIRPIWRPVVGEMITQGEKLSGRLGDSRDLRLAAAFCREQPWPENLETAIQEVVHGCNRRIEKLQPTLRRLTRRFYAERPRDFVKRLRGYWKVWEDPREV